MRVALLVNAPVSDRTCSEIREGKRPRQDFYELAERTGATVIAAGKASRWSWLPGWRYLATAWRGFRSRHQYDVLVSDIEHVGLLLAFLLKLSGAKNKHVMVCHGKITKPWALAMMRLFRLSTHINKFVFYGPAVASHVRRSLDLPEDRLVTVRHATDHIFWRPQGAPPERLVVGAGMLRRDWGALVEAVRGMNVQVVIAAHSPWVNGSWRRRGRSDLPPNVSFTRCTPVELRALYDRALFVAVPLFPSKAQSGSLVVYEAFAMGKAVVTTWTEGQKDLQLITPGETGYYVAPGDTLGWKAAISRLLANPEEARGMGGRARALVEARLNLDNYASELTALLNSLDVAHEGQGAAGIPAPR